MSFEKQYLRQKPGAFDKKKLLDELASDIANKYHIEKSQAAKLISQETFHNLADFKSDIQEQLSLQQSPLNEIEIQEFYDTIKGARDVIAKSSQIEIKALKESLSQSELDDIKRNLEEYLPKDLIQKAQNPQNIHEHVLGFALGSANSIYTTTDILLKIGTGVLKTPYHIYLIASGKAETDSFKNV